MEKRLTEASSGSGKMYVPSTDQPFGFTNTWSMCVTATWSRISTFTRWYFTASGTLRT
jgi:hypothetical protein